MAETALTVTSLGASGVTVAYANADTEHDNSFANNGKTILVMENGGASTATVTIMTGATTGGYAVADQAIAFTAGATKIAGPFAKDVFNDANGNVIVVCSGDGADDVDLMALSL